MSRDKIIEKVLNDVSVDSRITDGIFNIQNNQHIGYLCEYLISKGLNKSLVFEFAGTLLEKGNFPERQAYNSKGILVTFPTPEYKKEAIRAGTHFETDPTRGHPNVFSGNDKPPATEPPPGATAAQSAPTKTNLPVSTSTASPPAGEKDGEETSDPAQQMPNAFTTAAPQQTPNDDQSTEKNEPTNLPPPQPTPPAEKEANKDAVKRIFKGDDFMLEESLLSKTKDFINPKALIHYDAMANRWLESLNPWVFNAALGKHPNDPMAMILEVMKKGNFDFLQQKVFGLHTQYLFYYASNKILEELKPFLSNRKN